MRYLLPILLLYCNLAIAQHFKWEVNAERVQELQRMLKEEPDAALTRAAYMDIAYEYEMAKMPDKVEAAYRDILKRYPQYAESNTARQMLGEITLEKGDTVKAVQMLEAFVIDTALDYLEYDTTKPTVFGDPNLLSKAYACKTLVMVFDIQKNYPKLIQYMHLADSRYGMPNTCAIGANLDVQMSIERYYKAYTTLGDTAGAIKALLKYIVKDLCEPDMVYGTDLSLLHKLLLSQHSYEEIGQELKRSASNISVGKRDDYELIRCYTTIFGHKVLIDWVLQFDEKTGKPRLNNEILDEAYKNYTCKMFYKRYVKDTGK